MNCGDLFSDPLARTTGVNGCLAYQFRHLQARKASRNEYYKIRNPSAGLLNHSHITITFSMVFIVLRVQKNNSYQLNDC